MLQISARISIALLLLTALFVAIGRSNRRIIMGPARCHDFETSLHWADWGVTINRCACGIYPDSLPLDEKRNWVGFEYAKHDSGRSSGDESPGYKWTAFTIPYWALFPTLLIIPLVSVAFPKRVPVEMEWTGTPFPDPQEKLLTSPLSMADGNSYRT